MDKDLLLKPRIAEEDVEIPGVGAVRVRALTRAEVMSMRKSVADEDPDGPRALAIERKMLAQAMVDPAMSEDDVAAWQSASPAGELDRVVAAVQRMSGMDDGAAKGAYKSSRRRS